MFLTQYYSGGPIIGMQWAGHVAIWDERIACRTLVKKPEERNHLEDLGTDGRTVSKWILKEHIERAWTRFVWLRIGISGGLLLSRGIYCVAK